MAFSLPQLGLLAIALIVLIGAPMLIVGTVRSGSKNDLVRPLKFLHLGFWSAILSFALAMAAQRFFPATDTAGVLLFLEFYCFGWLYWTSLAVLAHRRGRSAVLWVVLGLATLAIGFFATYILMASYVRGVLKPQSRGDAPRAIPSATRNS